MEFYKIHYFYSTHEISFKLSFLKNFPGGHPKPIAKILDLPILNINYNPKLKNKEFCKDIDTEA